MASLCLPNCELYVGCDFQNHKDLDRALDLAEGNIALLYPGDDAKDVSTLPRTTPLTLVVVDGTWWQTRKMVRRNAKLAALPRVAFTPPRPSEYRIRKEPAEQCVSTIEALMYVLGSLEGCPDRFTALLKPFRAMVDAQIACRDKLHGARIRKRAHPRLSRSLIPDCIRERPKDLLCVIGEANAWPYCCPERGSQYPDELVHWVAFRPATGESFEYVVTPRNPLAQNTTRHIGLTESDLHAGRSLEGLISAWNQFLRPTDILCTWGHYATSLFSRSGGTLPTEQIDLRPLTHAVEKRRFGALEDYDVTTLALPFPPPNSRGRACVRLARLGAVAWDYANRTSNS
jgi:DTW domain-containing protein